jgi:pyrroloquinoline quinone biosynthesis protein B
VRVVVLGSGQDGGNPQLGFASGVGEPRTASSIAVLDGGRAYLIDASFDLRHQQRRLVGDPGYSTESGAVFDAVLLTHGHMGHYAGLLHFGKEANAARSIPLIASESMLGFLAGNEPWATLLGDGHLIPTVATGALHLGSLVVEPIQVPHRAEFTDTVAWSVRGDGAVLYLPDIDRWDAWPDAESVISSHDVALLDGTFFDEREPPGRSITEVPHPTIVDTMARFASLAASTRIVLTHLNHSNPAGDPGSPASAAVRAAGMELAGDGLILHA